MSEEVCDIFTIVQRCFAYSACDIWEIILSLCVPSIPFCIVSLVQWELYRCLWLRVSGACLDKFRVLQHSMLQWRFVSSWFSPPIPWQTSTYFSKAWKRTRLMSKLRPCKIADWLEKQFSLSRTAFQISRLLWLWVLPPQRGNANCLTNSVIWKAFDVASAVFVSHIIPAHPWQTQS